MRKGKKKLVKITTDNLAPLKSKFLLNSQVIVLDTGRSLLFFLVRVRACETQNFRTVQLIWSNCVHISHYKFRCIIYKIKIKCKET